MPTPGESGETPTPTPGEAPKPQPVTLELEVLTDPPDPLSRRFLVSATPAAAIELRCEEEGDQLERHRLSSPSASAHDLLLHGLKGETPYTCLAVATEDSSGQSDPVSFTTAPLPADLAVPVVTLVTDEPKNIGYQLYSVATLVGASSFDARYLAIVDALGNVRWYLPGVGGGDTDVSYLGDGRILYGGWSGESYTPTIIGLDRRTWFQATTGLSSPTEVEGSFHHDAGLSVDGASLFTLTHQWIDDLWEGFVVKEVDIDANEVVWSWDSYIDGVGQGVLTPGESVDRDPYHANTVYDQWEDGRLYLYISLRNVNQVLKIDHLTGAVVWVLGPEGDFTLLEPDGAPADPSRWFFYQHDVKAVEDRLLLYDNGTERIYYGGTAFSRALELEIDEEAMTARILAEYTESDWSEPVWGGYDPLPGGRRLLAIGHCWACERDGDLVGEEPTSALVLLEADGRVVWRADFPDPKSGIYRADRIDGCAIFHLEALCVEPSEGR